MFITKKQAVLLAVTVGVWTAAAGSAAALAYDLRHPVLHSAALSVPRVHHEASPTPRILDAPNEIVIPAITITAPAAPPTKFRATVAHERIQTTQTHCTKWHELQMGSGHFQFCQ